MAEKKKRNREKSFAESTLRIVLESAKEFNETYEKERMHVINKTIISPEKALKKFTL